jgi:ABC-type transport system substrate-binding protein
VGEIIGGNNGSAEMIQQYLADVGISAKVTSYETNTFVQMLMGGQFGLGITSGSGGQSAFENLRNYYGSDQPYNFNKFSNPQVDEIIGKLQVEKDDAEIERLLTEALNIVASEHTNMNLGIPGQFVVFRKGWSIPPVWNGVDMIAVR